ncbi:hypothetical protein Droror1_Dr00006406 [Drosera rotundifolia]
MELCKGFGFEDVAASSPPVNPQFAAGEKNTILLRHCRVLYQIIVGSFLAINQHEQRPKKLKPEPFMTVAPTAAVLITSVSRVNALSRFYTSLPATIDNHLS